VLVLLCELLINAQTRTT